MKKLFTGSFFVFFLLGFGSAYGQQDTTVKTIVGNGNQGYAGDGGPALSAEVDLVYGICLDDTGNIYLDDWNNHLVRKVSKKTGIINFIGGNGVAGYSGDGGPATSAEIHSPYGLTIDSVGNLYINDEVDNAVRKITASTKIITTIVSNGSGTQGYSGDGGPATSAQINNPHEGIVLDKAGNLYIGDYGNNCIRKVTKAGVISTFAGIGGGGGYSGDGGPASAAELNGPGGMVFDSSYTILFFSDNSNNVIRKIDMRTGIISTVVGIAGGGGYSGDGGKATLAEINDPGYLAISPGDGSLLIADAQNNVVRRVDLKTRIITTIVGNGVQGFAGDGGAPRKAEFAHLNMLAFTPTTPAQLLIGDDYNFRIRELVITDASGIDQIRNNDELTLYPNPATENISLASSKSIMQGTIVALYDIFGKEVWSKDISDPATIVSFSIHGLSAGTYIVKITPPGNNNTEVKKLVIY